MVRSIERILEYYDIKKLNNFEIKLVRYPFERNKPLIAINAAFYILTQKHKRGQVIVIYMHHFCFLYLIIIMLRNTRFRIRYKISDAKIYTEK